MIAIIDYGVGNLFSLKSSFDALGIEACVSGNADFIRCADRIVLPGVGAFRDAIGKLRESGLSDVVKAEARTGKPLLGICLGMQLLLDKSHEFGKYEGLGLVPGEVRPLKEAFLKAGLADGEDALSLKIPQMGWNALKLCSESPLFHKTSPGEHMYFVHSYYCDSPKPYVTAVCEYGFDVTAAVQNGNVFGCQFHPEKSGPAGLKILQAFSEL